MHVEELVERVVEELRQRRRSESTVAFCITISRSSSLSKGFAT